MSTNVEFFLMAVGIILAASIVLFLLRDESPLPASMKAPTRPMIREAAKEQPPVIRTPIITDERKAVVRPEAGSSVKPQIPAQAVSTSEQEFQQMQQCVAAYRQAMDAQGQLDVCKNSNNPRISACGGSSQDELKAKLDSLLGAGAKCGSDISAVEAAYYEKTRELALRGNRDAQLCFTQSMFQLDRSWSEEEISFFKANAPIFLQNALEQGDWRAIQLLTTSPRVLAHSKSLLGIIVPNSEFEQYKLNRLLRLGAVGKYAEQLDALATDPDVPIDADRLKQGEDWARREYEKFFRNSPMLQEAPQPCVVPG